MNKLIIVAIIALTQFGCSNQNVEYLRYQAARAHTACLHSATTADAMESCSLAYKIAMDALR